MIKTVYIKNFILIDEILLDFTEGFNVLLGETGAGKSIIIKAIDTALGAKTSKEALKDENAHALIEITFNTPYGETVISREISTTGTKCRINGALVNLESIKEEREKLIDIHSQFQTYAYMKQKFHIELLDSYIKAKENDFKAILDKTEREFKRFIEAKKLLFEIENEQTTDSNRIEFLKFQINEIENADIKENEEEELNRELEILSNVKELKELSYGSYWALSGEENSVTEAMSKIGFNISKIKEYDPEKNEIEENYFNALETVKDISNSLRNYSDSLEDNPQRLDELNERLELIEKLKRKYGDIFVSYEKFKSELKTLLEKTVSTKELKEEVNALEISLNENSLKIDELRQKYSIELSEIITNELKKLEFECPVFKIDVIQTELNSKGKNDVEFMITTNAAKDLAPLVKTASGGEISRIMLALKTVFANLDKISTVIFDEIDTGISGKTSVSVANEIFELSKTIQVFAITHQPIIASKARNTYWVSKLQTENDTKISVRKLDREGKIQALAQMSSGVINEKSLNFAKELVEKAAVKI